MTAQLFRRREQQIRLSLTQKGAWTEAVLFLETAGELPPQESGGESRTPGRPRR